MSKYKVITYGLEYFDYGEIVSKGTNGEAIGETNGAMYSWEIVERNPDWFKKIEPEVKEGQYWRWKGDNPKLKTFRIQEIFSETKRCKVKYLNGVKKGWYWDGITEDAIYLYGNNIEQALIEEAKRRGYKKSGKIKNWLPNIDDPVIIGEDEGFEYNSRNDYLTLGHTFIYKRGQWAEIIEDEWEVTESPLYRRVEKDGRVITNLNHENISKKEAEAIAKALNELDNEN